MVECTLKDESFKRREITEVYNRASLRERAMISLIAKSGVRLEVIGNHDGIDGLCIKNIVDLVIYGNKARCTKVHIKIIVRSEILGKIHVLYILHSVWYESCIGT